MNDPISKSQVKPLLNYLAKNYEVFLISFEKKIIKKKLNMLIFGKNLNMKILNFQNFY